jgi:hypothetical protein
VRSPGVRTFRGRPRARAENATSVVKQALNFTGPPFLFHCFNGLGKPGEELLDLPQAEAHCEPSQPGVVHGEALAAGQSLPEALQAFGLGGEELRDEVRGVAAQEIELGQ